MTAPLHMPLRVVILRSQYHETITANLLDGAVSELRAHGLDDSQFEIVTVPGAFELATAAARVVKRLNVDAVIALGCVVRGETPHFDFICQACANGLSRVGESSGKPVTFGVITANTVEQAFERAGGRVGNKGQEAARAALELVSALKLWEQQQVTGS
ncbi:MAG: 6,7-dimethyl-8-ribityllumazine synthase [bacterium]|nr:6,7-dimethyl-8-ribityllumazine synthase [bacterium]